MTNKNFDRGRQGTDKPWLRPGQSSQDPTIEPPTRKDREGRYEAPPAEAPRPAEAPPDKPGKTPQPTRRT